ncbi:MAG: TetR/AcrR family transcriptional regulator [Coriobacteriales bacterium]|nr:TetR/AcrR family transcriptional regulator [Coriobacteriales bacterium]
MTAATSPEERTRLRQQRTMTYFIEAAEKIVREEGLEAVTIRKVSDAAGYTSATLYHYFDNLDHLVFFATMGYYEEYSKELSKRLAGVTDPLEAYHVTAKTFAHHVYTNPEVFSLRFSVNHSDKIDAYARQYYDLFPEKRPSGFDLLSRTSMVNDLGERNAIYLSPLVEAGLLSEEDAEEVNDLTRIVFRFYLQEVRLGSLDVETALAKCDYYAHRVFDFYLKGRPA